MRNWTILLGGVAILTMAGTVTAQRKPAAKPRATARPASQIVTGPKDRYAMDVGTMTGIGAGMGMGGANSGKRPSMGQMMDMMNGGGGDQHELRLRLGSTLPPQGAPEGDHFFNPRAAMGASVPLVTPEIRPTEDVPENFQRPKGRMLIFWGCGAHAGPGQPVVIDFAALAAGQMPPNLFTSRVPLDRGPTINNSKTYGEWPNKLSGKQPQGGSLLGEHRVSSTYAPEIQFTLGQSYMAGLHVRTAPGAEGGLGLSWNMVPNATGYYAWMIGAKDAGKRGRNDTGDVVWWSSSNSREFGGALWDWIAPGTVDRLVNEGTVLAPSTTNCTVPAEVKQAAGEMMFGTMIAYGPEQNFVYPPKPDTGPWNQEWSARVRYRSLATFFPGMPDMNEAAGPNGQQRKRCKPSLFGAMTGLGGGC